MYSTGSKMHYFSQKLAMNADINAIFYVEAAGSSGRGVIFNWMALVF